MINILAKINTKLAYLLTNRFPRLLINPWERFRNPYPHSFVKQTTRGWSVVIITSGTDLGMLEQVITSIEQALQGSAAEIILVAPPSFQLSRTFNIPIKYCSYHDSKFLPALITRKKNLGVRLSQYDKVVVCHDYLLFSPSWKAAWDNFTDDFEVATNQVLRQDGSRLLDWTVCDYPELGFALLPYAASANQYQYISGTYFVVKRDFYLANPLNEGLRWGEGEDIEWSKRIRTKTIFKFNPAALVTCAKFKEADSKEWLENSLKLKELLNQPAV